MKVELRFYYAKDAEEKYIFRASLDRYIFIFLLPRQIESESQQSTIL